MKSTISVSFGRRMALGAMRFLTVLVGVAAIATMAWAAVPKVGEKAPDFTIRALDDSQVKLASALKKGPVVLVILRGYPGYQCPICTVQVGALIKSAAKFEERKAQVILVYPGPAEGLKAHANEFVTGKDMPKSFQLTLDPDYALLKKYDLRWDAPNETSYPSTFVIDKKGKIVYAKVSHSHGDRAKLDDILKSLDDQKMMDDKMEAEKKAPR
ncbi:MAG: resA 9 [Chthonomonadales bacterium]|nr:resA 9 [Chthonomonadales bacterium]